MTTPSMNSQFPQPPVPYMPDPAARPAPPASILRAVNLMYAGAILAVAFGVAFGLMSHSSNTISVPGANPSSSAYHAGYIAGGAIAGLILGGLWLWMAWKIRAGRNWARVLSTVFFGLFCVYFLGALIEVIVAPWYIVPGLLVIAGWGVGLAALILLWGRESSQFVEAVRLKRAGAFLPPAFGYPALGYGQPGQSYGHPVQDGTTPRAAPPPPYNWPQPPQ